MGEEGQREEEERERGDDVSEFWAERRDQKQTEDKGKKEKGEKTFGEADQKRGCVVFL